MRARKLSPAQEAAVRNHLAMVPIGRREQAYEDWAAQMGVSVNTIQRTVQRWAGRVPEGAPVATRAKTSAEAVCTVA